MKYSIKSIHESRVKLKFDSKHRKLDYSNTVEYTNLDESEVLEVLQELLDVIPDEPEPKLNAPFEVPEEVSRKILRNYNMRMSKYHEIADDFRGFADSSDSEHIYELENVFEKDSNPEDMETVGDSISISKVE